MNRHNQGRPKSRSGINQQQALASGLKFFNGKECEKDPTHGNIRYAHNNSCMSCAREASKAQTADRRTKAATKRESNRTIMSDPTAFKRPVFVLGNPDRVRAQS